MTPNEISSAVFSYQRKISYPYRVWLEPQIPITEPYRPRRYEDQTKTGTFHGFGVEGSAGDELVVVCIIETEDGSIVTPIATKCKFLK
jgi:hypothetical protein